MFLEQSQILTVSTSKSMKINAINVILDIHLKMMELNASKIYQTALKWTIQRLPITVLNVIKATI